MTETPAPCPSTSYAHELQTQRLRLIPLDAANLRCSLQDPRRLEQNLGLRRRLCDPAPDVLEATRQMLDGVLKQPEHWLFYTAWKIVLREENRIIGGLCFKRPADRCGEVEVGYGLDPAYQGRGYMTEALTAIVRWALDQPGVLAVLGETAKQNVASQQVLERAGFVRYRETDEYLWWRISREPPATQEPKSSPNKPGEHRGMCPQQPV